MKTPPSYYSVNNKNKMSVSTGVFGGSALSRVEHFLADFLSAFKLLQFVFVAHAKLYKNSHCSNGFHNLFSRQNRKTNLHTNTVKFREF